MAICFTVEVEDEITTYQPADNGAAHSLGVGDMVGSISGPGLGYARLRVQA